MHPAAPSHRQLLPAATSAAGLWGTDVPPVSSHGAGGWQDHRVHVLLHRRDIFPGLSQQMEKGSGATCLETGLELGAMPVLSLNGSPACRATSPLAVRFIAH